METVKEGLNWQRMVDVMALLTVLSFVLERTLAPFLEHRWFLSRAGGKGLKEVIGLVAGIAFCRYFDIDAVSALLSKEKEWVATSPGMFITGATLAGGSKASIKLFQDVLGIKSTALAAYQEKNKAEAKAQPQGADAGTGGGG